MTGDGIGPTSLDLEQVDIVRRTATGFMASKFLFTAAALGLFEHLADGPLDVGQLASKAGAPARTVRIIVDAIVAVGLMQRENERYRNSPAAQALLTGRGPRDLRPMLRHFDRILYPSWMELLVAVRTEQPVRSQLDEEAQRVLSEGVESITSAAASALPQQYDFHVHRRVLDLGGGTGSLLIAILAKYPHLQGTLVDTPVVGAIARERFAQAGLADRTAVVEGDLLSSELPGGHDVVLIANVLHLLAPDRNKLLLQRARECVTAGGRLLLVDLFTDETHTRPMFAALMAGTFLTGFGEGDVYSDSEVSGWLRQTGWRPSGTASLADPFSLLIGAPV